MSENLEHQADRDKILVANIRKQIARVVDHWATQRGVSVAELIYRINCAPLRPDRDGFDPIHQVDTWPPVRQCMSERLRVFKAELDSLIEELSR